VKKVAFLATPHTGSGWAVWGDRLRILVYPSAATASLVRNDPNLRDLNLWYRDWASSSGIAHLILVETRPSNIFGMVVRPDSSDPGITGARPVPIDANHIEICKPKDRSSDVYVHVRAFVERRIGLPSLLEEKHGREPTIFQTANTTSGHIGSITNNITINSLGDSENMDSRLTEILRNIGSHGGLDEGAKASQERKE